MPVGGQTDDGDEGDALAPPPAAFSNPLSDDGEEEETGEEEADDVSTEEAEEVDEMTFRAETMLRETVSAVHRATASPSGAVRAAALSSVEAMARECPLVVLQTWLDQFARTNGGVSPTEYVANDRVHLLTSLARIAEVLLPQLDDTQPGQKACIERIIALSAVEMTRQPDVIPNVQKPCSQVLVTLSEKFINRVMDSLVGKFQPGVSVHYYVVVTLSKVAQANAMGFLPFLKGLLGTMVANMRSVRKDNMRYAYAEAMSRFSEALTEYLINVRETPDPSVTREHFEREMDLAHDIMFVSWLSKSDVKARQSILEALGCMASHISLERVTKSVATILSVLVSTYKRVPEPFFVTQCISQLIDAVIARDMSPILDPMIEPLLTALFTQVGLTSAADYSKPYAMKNHHEVLRCYDVLVHSHKEKLIAGLIVRMGSVDENIRLASLTIFKHLMSSSLDKFEDRMPDVFRAMHSKLNDPSNKVKKMLAQLTAQLGRLGYLKQQGNEGRDFIEFIIRLCALPCEDDKSPAPLTLPDSETAQPPASAATTEEVTNRTLKEMCDSILLLLATSVDAMEEVLFPHLMDYLLAPDFGNAVPSVVKSLNALTMKTRADADDEAAEASLSSLTDSFIDYSKFVHVPGPYAVLARLFVLAAVPFPGSRGATILTFLQNFASSINKHIPPLWKQRIPLLLTYVETHTPPSTSSSVVNASASGTGSAAAAASAWDQNQWEEWLLALLDDTVKEIDLDEWTVALAGAMTQQLSLYAHKTQIGEKCFLMRALGQVLKSTSWTLIMERLNVVFASTNHAEDRQQLACAKAFGICAVNHLPLVLDKLETLLKAGAQKKSSSFFGLLKDTRLAEEQLQERCTILLCVGQAAIYAAKPNLKQKANEITVKFVMPALKGTSTVLRLAALRALTGLAVALQCDKMWSSPEETRLAQHGDLIHETIACLRDEGWSVAHKETALSAILELVRLPPFITQSARCSLLKACFTAVFPGLVSETFTKEETYGVLSKAEGQLRQIVDRLQTLVQELLKQELSQSTLDEIFTLLEPWLKRDCAVAREISIGLLRTCLETYQQHVDFKVGEPTSFSPGPYIIGSVVPRCFDNSRQVQNTGLQCLQITIKILSDFEGRDRGAVEEALAKLKALSVMSPDHLDNEPVWRSSSLVSKTMSEILRERVSHAQLLPLLHSVADAILDEISSSARGASMVLCSLVEARGSELYPHVADLVSDRIHSKLAVLDDSETRVRTLTCARVLASFNPRETASKLLTEHPLPLDEAAESIWRVLTQEPPLAEEVMRYLLELISSPTLAFYSSSERREGLSNRPSRVAKHLPLAAIVALGTMFDMKEMEAICDGEFDSVVVPLLTAMGAYMGITEVESKRRRGSVMAVPQPPPAKTKTAEEGLSLGFTEERRNDPFFRAKSTLHAFLNCKRCTSVAAVLEHNDKDLSTSVRVNTFATELAAPLIQTVIQDFPQLLPKLVTGFQPYLTAGQHGGDIDSEQDGGGASSGELGNRLAAIALNAELAQAETLSVESSLIEKGIDNVLAALKWKETQPPCDEDTPASNDADGGGGGGGGEGAASSGADSELVDAKVLCIKSLAAFKLRQDANEREVKNYGSIILYAFLEVVGGEDLTSDLNFNALVGLHRLLEGGHLSEPDVQRVLTEIAGKVRPFFDCGKERDSEAAIECFCQLSAFASGSYRAVYADHVNQSLVSLILHTNDNVVGTCHASKAGLAKIMKVVLETPVDFAAADKHLMQDCASFNYLGFLKDLCAVLASDSSLREHVPSYVSRALAYFKSPSQRLRASSVLLITQLVLASDDRLLEDMGEEQADAVCKGMSALIAGDKSQLVQEAAALNIGKVFVHFRQQPRKSNANGDGAS